MSRALRRAIELRNLGKRYRKGAIHSGTLAGDLKEYLGGRASSAEHWALRGINLDVLQGEVLGIVGPNGAGKSTLLKILSRITAPTTGTVRLRGRFASLLEVGTGMHPELSGRDNVYLNGAILGMSRREVRSKLHHIASFSGVESWLDTPVKRYSSGMKVRLGFSVAAFLQPEVLVVDEVLAVGDTAFQKQAIARMQEVSKGGCTILFVSHNLTAVRSLCKRSILLNDGALVYEGSTAHCLAKYLGYEAAPGSLRRTWSGLDAPAGGSFRMSEAEVCALLPDGSSTDMLDVSLPLRIRVGIACDGVKVPDVSVHILSDEGEFLAASSTLYHRDASRRPEQRGDVVYHSCTIPAHFFNHHSYRLRVLVVEDRITTVLRLDDLFHISFVPPARPESTWMGHTASHFIVGWEWA